MADRHIEKIVEALLFSMDKPLPADKIQDAIGEKIDIGTVKEAVEQLRAFYAAQERSFDIAEIAGGYQIVTRPEFSNWISKLYKRPHDKIRGASMETLAIIVYKQPITKAEIEAIRGVAVDGVVKTLLEKNLIKIQGRKDAPGRPLMYATTEEFLHRFGLKDVNSLPPLKEFTEKDLDYAKNLYDLEEGNVDAGQAPLEAPDSPGVQHQHESVESDDANSPQADAPAEDVKEVDNEELEKTSE